MVAPLSLFHPLKDAQAMMERAWNELATHGYGRRLCSADLESSWRDEGMILAEG